MIRYSFPRQQLLSGRVEMRIQVPNRELTVLSKTPKNLVKNLSKDMGSSSINSPSINNVQWLNMVQSVIVTCYVVEQFPYTFFVCHMIFYSLQIYYLYIKIFLYFLSWYVIVSRYSHILCFWCIVPMIALYGEVSCHDTVVSLVSVVSWHSFS